MPRCAVGPSARVRDHLHVLDTTTHDVGRQRGTAYPSDSCRFAKSSIDLITCLPQG